MPGTTDISPKQNSGLSCSSDLDMKYQRSRKTKHKIRQTQEHVQTRLRTSSEEKTPKQITSRKYVVQSFPLITW